MGTYLKSWSREPRSIGTEAIEDCSTEILCIDSTRYLVKAFCNYQSLQRSFLLRWNRRTHLSINQKSNPFPRILIDVVHLLEVLQSPFGILEVFSDSDELLNLVVAFLRVMLARFEICEAKIKRVSEE